MEWYHELRNTILAEGWTSSQHNDCIYFKKSEDGSIAILMNYLDDTATTGEFTEEIQRIRASLLETYEGRDLGTPDKLFGVGNTVGEDGITLDQQLYAESIIMDGMGFMEIRTTSTRLDPGMDLSARQDYKEEPEFFPQSSMYR
ncbi:unnamed protein product, partial [Choristocarpus tenellus]